jgi:hypothetical protein
MSQPDTRSDNNVDVDVKLRTALAPDQQAVRRIVTRALAETPTAGERPPLWRLATAPVLVVVVLAVSIVLLWKVREVPELGSAEPRVLVIEAAEPPAYRISNIGDVLTLTKPNGQVVAIASGGTS